MLSVILAASALFAGGAAAAPIQDDGLIATLKEAGLSSEDIGAFHKLKYNLTDTSRKQTVFVRKKSAAYLSLTMYEIFSLVWEGDGEPPEEVLGTVYEARPAFGSVICEAPSGEQTKHRVRYRTMVCDTIPAAKLKAYAAVVAATADAYEKMLNPNAEDTF